MNKELLIQYCDLREEIKDIRNRIDKLQQQQERIISDVVRCSSKEFPYLERNTKICIDYSDKNPKIRKYKNLLMLYNEELLDNQIKVEEEIQKVTDSQLRRILRYRYIDNMNWEQVARKMNLGTSCVKMIHKRFLEKN